MSACSVCRTENPVGARFCNGCGQRLPAAEDVPASVTTPEPNLAALIAGTSPGTALVLPAGEYRVGEPLDVARDLTIRGAGSDATVLLCPGPEPLLTVTAGSVKLEGLGVRYCGDEAGDVLVCTGGSLSLRRCRVAGGRGACREGRAALRVAGGAVEVLETAFCDNTAMAIYAYGETTLHVAQSSFTGNDIAIGIDGPAHARIERNAIQFHSFGIVAGGPARVVVEGTTCTGDPASAEAQLDSAGIAFNGTTTGAARNNTCTATKFGISADQQAHVELIGNLCRDNKFAGIVFSGTAGGAARGNRCEGNGDGIFLMEGATPDLEENTLQANRFSGLDYTATSGGAARRNQCAANQHSGIVIAGQATPLIEGNACTGNRLDGIAVRNTSRPQVRGNVCQGNGGFAINVDPSARPLLAHNQDLGNGGWAWAMRGGGAPTAGPR